jgi:hypothetical protein
MTTNYDICVCQNCHTQFKKSLAEIKRKTKNKTPFYCSRSCSGKSNYNHALHKKLNNSKQNINHLKGICGNRKDCYSPFRMLLQRTKQRKHKNNLSLIYIKSMWESQNGKCAVLGHDLQLPSTSKIKQNQLASIDRIDSSKGYVEGNIRIVCATINYAKNQSSDKELQQFIALCKNSEIRQ